MERTIRSFSFAVEVEPTDNWPEEQVEVADEADDDSYEDYAIRILREVMQRAGEEFIQDNPDMYYGPLH